MGKAPFPLPLRPGDPILGFQPSADDLLAVSSLSSALIRSALENNGSVSLAAG
jgi:hypothetical protein